MAVRSAVAALFAVLLFAVAGPYDALLEMPLSKVAVLLSTALLLSLGDTAFVRAMAFEDVSRVFTVSTGLYILVSVSASIIFAGEAFSLLLIVGGLAVLVGSRFVMQAQSRPGGSAPARVRQPVQALAMAVLAAVTWSTALLLISDAMETVEPLAANALRLPFTALSLALISGLRGDHRRKVSWQDINPILVSGVCIAGATVLFLTSTKLANVGSVAVLTSTSPIFVAPLAHFFLHERLTYGMAGGIATCMLGVWLASV